MFPQQLIHTHFFPMCQYLRVIKKFPLNGTRCIFNLVLRLSKFSEIWKKSRVSPVFKKMILKTTSQKTTSHCLLFAILRKYLKLYLWSIIQFDQKVDFFWWIQLNKRPTVSICLPPQYVSEVIDKNAMWMWYTRISKKHLIEFDQRSIYYLINWTVLVFRRHYLNCSNHMYWDEKK